MSLHRWQLSQSQEVKGVASSPPEIVIVKYFPMSALTRDRLYDWN